MNRNSIILLSGGLDCTVSLAKAKDAYNITLALTFDYGQKSKEQEIAAASKIAEYYSIEHKVIKLEWLEHITQTSLVKNNSSIPELKANELDNTVITTESAKNVWVPNRNGVFLNIAASFCDSYGYTNIIFGANKEEGTTFPDNTQEFIDKINSSFKFSTLNAPEVVAPLINSTKEDIVKLGIEHNAPFKLIRSCYTNTDKHCGRCESCMRLLRALKSLNQNDVIEEIFELTGKL